MTGLFLRRLSKRNIFYSREDSMGTGSSKPEPSNDKQCVNTAAPTTASTLGFPEHFDIQHLVLAFFAGVLLTLLLLALIFFVIKSYRKCHSSPWALDPPTDPHSGREPPAKLSSPEEALTYASVAFKISEEKTDHLTKKHSTPLDSVVYAPVKVTDSLHLSNEA
ncbi:transmembrane protein C1orf162 homolog isoform X1 [Ursus americanus]|uniref:Transmembrane protein C1orf162 homolog isoform X1 n=2 Tax=Ursus maritimus TaxID=29073 RepID=A0A8M1FHF3_URSMA|nr:transmembrane protein C1orf162 homolog isoform X1 [Ursus maritimus]XP_045657465.1 transmembrane protein C1orf162 homolog isoform X1 [Ursus americanus]